MFLSRAGRFFRFLDRISRTLFGSRLIETIKLMPPESTIWTSGLSDFLVRRGRDVRIGNDPSSSDAAPLVPLTATSSDIAVRALSEDLGAPSNWTSIPEAASDGRRRFRLGREGSSTSSDAFLLRRDREPSIGSSSRIRVLKTEWESGLTAPRADGSKSLAIFGAEDLRRAIEPVAFLTSSSNPFSTQVLQRQCAASTSRVSMYRSSMCREMIRHYHHGPEAS